MKSILFLVSLYKPNFGGIENSVSELTKEFLRMGYEVIIVCSDRDYISSSKLKRFENIDGAHVYRYEYPTGFLGFIKQIFNCYEVVRSNELQFSDVFIARSPVPILAAFMAGARKIKYIVPSVFVYQVNISQLKSPKVFFSFLVNSFFQLVSLLLSENYAFSKSVCRQIKTASFGMKGATLIKPGISNERFFPLDCSDKKSLRARFGIPTGARVILGLGRFSEIKRFDHIIRSAKFCDDNFYFVIVGDGPESKNYNKLISDLDLGSKVKVFPSTTSPELYFQLSDLFVMTSRYEAFGQVLLEATSCGLPIVAYPNSTDTDTSVHQIYKGYPHLVFFTQKSSPEHLAESIKKFNTIESSNEFDKEYFELRSKYSWQSMAEYLVSKN
jgi:1,2-diacylglycerol 3-alpha-glucosyltransferase